MSRRVIYCHGLPGSPQELSAFGTPLPRDVQGLERLGRCEESYEDRVLSAFDDLKVAAPITLAGFSLGAMSATYIAAKRGRLVDKLILISPAAPLQLGDFLPTMAGRAVFEAARAGDWALRALCASQSVLTALAPKLVVRTMFRRSPDAEIHLLDSSRFVGQVTYGLQTCLGTQQSAYRQELQAYVRPWAHIIREVQCNTEIWSGADDDWTPPAMAAAYKTQLRDVATLYVCAGLGHYSTLRAALLSLQ